MTIQHTNNLPTSHEEALVTKSLCRDFAKTLAAMAHINPRSSHLAVLLDTGSEGNNIDVLSEWVERKCDEMLEAHDRGIRPIEFFYHALMQDLYRASMRVVEDYPW